MHNVSVSTATTQPSTAHGAEVQTLRAQRADSPCAVQPHGTSYMASLCIVKLFAHCHPGTHTRDHKLSIGIRAALTVQCLLYYHTSRAQTLNRQSSNVSVGDHLGCLIPSLSSEHNAVHSRYISIFVCKGMGWRTSHHVLFACMPMVRPSMQLLAAQLDCNVPTQKLGVRRHPSTNNCLRKALPPCRKGITACLWHPLKGETQKQPEKHPNESQCSSSRFTAASGVTNVPHPHYQR